MAEARFFHISRNAQPRSLAGFDEAVACLESPGYVWFDYFDPTREQLEPLVNVLGVHPVTIEDCLDENQIPKLEDFPGHTFLLVNAFTYDGETLLIEEIDLVIGKSFLVTVHGHGTAGRRFLDRLDERIRVELDTVARGAEYLMYVILDSIIDRKLAAVEALQDRIDATEDDLIQEAGAFEPGNLLRLRRDLLTMRKSLFHEREILGKLCRRDSPFVGEKAIYYYRDAYDHLAKAFEIVELCREMINNAMEMYLSLLNNAMAVAANRTNATVRRLTLITTVFMPLTLLAGIGGMSEWTMMTGAANWRVSYPIFLTAMAAIGAISYRALVWLERREPGARSLEPMNEGLKRQ